MVNKLKQKPDKSHPIRWFIFGLFINSITLLLVALAFFALLLVARAIFSQIPAYVPFIPLGIWFAKALLIQLLIVIIGAIEESRKRKRGGNPLLNNPESGSLSEEVRRGDKTNGSSLTKE